LFNAPQSENWGHCEIGANNYGACSIEHVFGAHTHRVVCYRWKNKTGQVKTITGDDNCYLFIITNDRNKNEKQVIEFYNARGKSEKLFDIQNNDFNWNKLPYSFLGQNTVYLIVMAISNIIYQWIIKHFSKACDFIEPHFRLKKFRFRIICIAGKVIKSGRRTFIKLFTPKKIIIKNFSP